jgi:isopenicillin-N epimerase
MNQHFLLRPDVVFLNHGSYGACPRPVFETYQNWQRELELQPVEFLNRRYRGLMETARAELAAYLHITKNNLVYVTNATTGVNIVARSLPLKAGDEVLGTNHEYGAVDRTWRFLNGKTGAVYLNHPMPLPMTTPEEFIENFWQAVTPRTKIISLSHITSPTALIFPLKEICRRAREAGILTVIDGAHAPGQIPLDLPDIGADFYAGNCHKWLCAPKGAGFLYARPEVQPLLEPLVVSWGYESLVPSDSRFVDWQEFLGTRDIANFLSVPAAIQFQKEHNWAEISQTCHQMLVELRQEMQDLTGLPHPCPEDWFAQMAIIPVPPCDVVSLKNYLWDEHKIEVPVINWDNQQFVRVSVQAYNTPQDLTALVSALKNFFKFPA